MTLQKNRETLLREVPIVGKHFCDVALAHFHHRDAIYLLTPITACNIVPSSERAGPQALRFSLPLRPSPNDALLLTCRHELRRIAIQRNLVSSNTA